MIIAFLYQILQKKFNENKINKKMGHFYLHWFDVLSEGVKK